MNSKVDKFFKEKLEDHILSPSPKAWERLEAQLVKKNKMVVVYRVAAVLAVFGLSTFMLIRWPTNNEDRPALTKYNVKKEEVPAVAKEEEKSKPPAATTKKRSPQKPAEKKATPEKPDVVDLNEKEITVPMEQAEHPALAELVPSIREEKKIVLVYSLPAVAKKQSPEFDMAQEKKSGIQRVFEAAKDVKNSDNPLGELREAKNDLFALDFRRDKDKSKNQ